MKFKPVDFWGTEQRKKKQKPKTEPCPYCGCNIDEEFGYVETRYTEYVHGIFDGEAHEYDGSERSDTYSCPNCGFDFGNLDVRKYLKKGR